MIVGVFQTVHIVFVRFGEDEGVAVHGNIRYCLLAVIHDRRTRRFRPFLFVERRVVDAEHVHLLNVRLQRVVAQALRAESHLDGLNIGGRFPRVAVERSIREINGAVKAVRDLDKLAVFDAIELFILVPRRRVIDGACLARVERVALIRFSRAVRKRNAHEHGGQTGVFYVHLHRRAISRHGVRGIESHAHGLAAAALYVRADENGRFAEIRPDPAGTFVPTATVAQTVIQAKTAFHLFI